MPEPAVETTDPPTGQIFSVTSYFFLGLGHLVDFDLPPARWWRFPQPYACGRCGNLEGCQVAFAPIANRMFAEDQLEHCRILSGNRNAQLAANQQILSRPIELKIANDLHRFGIGAASRYLRPTWCAVEWLASRPGNERYRRLATG
jgi:hypothetical protein